MRLRFLNRHFVAGVLLANVFAAGQPLVANAQNAGMPAGSQGHSTSPRAGIRGQAMEPPKREALFQDGQFNWPKLPFSRGKHEQPTVRDFQQPPTSGMTPKSARPPQRAAAVGSNATPAQARGPMNRPQPVGMNSQVRQTAIQPARPVAAQPQRVPLSAPEPTQSTPRLSPSARVAPTVTSTASEPASASILTEAHQRSKTAKTEQDYSAVIELCRQALETQPEDEVALYGNRLAAWALNRRGQLHAEASRNEEALCDFDIAIEADAKCWRAVHNRGVLLAQTGEFEEAFNDFTRCININPKFAKAYANRAALFVVAGDLDLAMQDYMQSVKLDPQLAVAHRGLGRCCHLSKELEVALRHFDEAVRLSPNDAFAIASRADVMTDLGRYSEAVAEYERAIRIDPKSSHAHNGSAWLLATCPDGAIRNPQLALERAEVALNLIGDTDASSLDTLAAAQANAGDFSGAAKSVEQAVVLATDSQKQAFEARLLLYQQKKPYRLSPLERVAQASHQTQLK